MVERNSEDIKSEKRQLDTIRRERDSILRLLNQARLANVNQEVKNLIQEFDRLDAVLSEDDSYSYEVFDIDQKIPIEFALVSYENQPRVMALTKIFPLYELSKDV